jgi:hypothetical protein
VKKASGQAACVLTGQYPASNIAGLRRKPWFIHTRSSYCGWRPGLLFCFFWALAATSFAVNEVLGEIELVGATKVERTSGVWIDEQ